MPNLDKQWFSFIYRDYKDIPEVIQFFMISQDDEFLKKFKKVKFEDLT